MTRKIIPTQSVSLAPGSTTQLPSGARIFQVIGECTSNPTYDFTVIRSVYSRANVAVVQYSVKYCGTRNGAKVSLWKEFPEITTINSVPTAVGDEALYVTSGTTVSLQIYYCFGLVDTA